MDRRKSIKALLIGTASTGIVLDACKTPTAKDPQAGADAFAGLDRMKEEKAAYDKVVAEGVFFTEHQMKTIIVLEDIIIPKDAVSGSASDAKVHDFIEFIVKDKPELQTPILGGLRWLDMESFKRFNTSFVDATHEQQIQIVDDIAYPEIEFQDEKGTIVKKGKVKPGLEPGVAFFSKMRDLVASGFYTSEIGVKDVGYKGNVPNQWNGVPDDVLKQYGLAYTEKELKECVSFDVVK
jgi:gluconate 2-dehydrogenase gamma chain